MTHAVRAVEAGDKGRAGQDTDNNNERNRSGSNGEREWLCRNGVGQFVLQDARAAPLTGSPVRRS